MIVLIWIDWYPYHHARLRALLRHPRMGGHAAGIELVGRTGVHKGLVFRETAEASLPLTTLMPDADWSLSTQARGAVLLWKELNRLNPDVVFVPGYYTLPALAAALWGRAMRRRTVMMTESTQHDHARTPWKEYAKGALIRLLFDYAIAGGKAHKRYLHALGFPAGRVAGCYDVVDNDFYSAQARALRQAGPAAATPYFLFVGRLAQEKNVGGLIHEYANYRREGGAWRLLLAGAGPEEAALKKQANESGFGSDIVFAGLKNAQELAAYYAHAACFVLPSTREPWGLVVNEAMAAALPVVVSNRCGCVEDLVVAGENGFVFDPATPGDLASRLMAMEKCGEQPRAEMARASGRIVAAVSPQRWAEEVASIAMPPAAQALEMAVSQ